MASCLVPDRRVPPRWRDARGPGAGRGRRQAQSTPPGAKLRLAFR